MIGTKGRKSNEQIYLSEPHSPMFKMNLKRSITMSQSKVKRHYRVNAFRNNPKRERNEYAKLTLKSVQNKVPVKQLKPFASFTSIEEIQDRIEGSILPSPLAFNRNLGFNAMSKSQVIQKKSNWHQNFTINLKPAYQMKDMNDKQESKERANKKFNQIDDLKKRGIENCVSIYSSQNSANKYEVRKSKKKCKNGLKRNKTDIEYGFLSYEQNPEESMVLEFLRDQTQNKKFLSSTVDFVNSKVASKCPDIFEVQSKGNNTKMKRQTFFRLKNQENVDKDCTEKQNNEKYQILQPEQCNFDKRSLSRQFMETMKDSNKKFSVFARSKKKILEADPDLDIVSAMKKKKEDVDATGYDIWLRAVFEKQSEAIFKNYMRQAGTRRKKDSLFKCMKFLKG